MKLFEWLLDFDILLTAEYEGDILNDYRLGKIKVNGTEVKLSAEQEAELFEAIFEHDLFFEEEEIDMVDE